jgi:coproporphyrinogen III oxidase
MGREIQERAALTKGQDAIVTAKISNEATAAYRAIAWEREERMGWGVSRDEREGSMGMRGPQN